MRATQPRPYGCASSACGARRSSGFSSTSVPVTGEPTATVRLERPWTVASVSPTSTRSTAQYSTSGVYQSTSPSGAVTPTVTIPSSNCAHTWRPARYRRSDGSAKRADGAAAATEISGTPRAWRLRRTELPSCASRGPCPRRSDAVLRKPRAVPAAQRCRLAQAAGRARGAAMPSCASRGPCPRRSDAVTAQAAGRARGAAVPSPRAHDPPRRLVRPVERERPAPGEGHRAVLRATHHGGRVAVLHVAVPAELEGHGHRRGNPLHLDRRDLDPLHARPADHEAGLPARIARVQQLAHRLGRCDALERSVVAVHGLRPGTHRGARGGL